MATGHDIITLKKEAAAKMERGRHGLDEEIHRLRTELSPSRMAHKVMDRHSVAVLASAFGLGVLLPLFLFRSAPEVAMEAEPIRKRAVQKKNSLIGSLLSQAISISLPMVIRSLANKYLLVPRPQPAPAADATPSDFHPGAS